MTLDLHAELLQRDVVCTPLDTTAARAFAQRWSSTFAPSPPPQPCPYRWHTFSFQLYQCLEGAAALSAYLDQWYAPFYMFDEALDFCALCEAQAYPDLSALRRDIYVAHQNLKWTVAFTHEQPHLGPFFAERFVNSSEIN